MKSLKSLTSTNDEFEGLMGFRINLLEDLEADPN